jgi:DNA-binding FrmR family transcriptional regulator
MAANSDPHDIPPNHATRVERSGFNGETRVMDNDTRQQVEARLARVAGQVAGIQRMVEGDRYCVDILTQIAAARAALAKVGKALLESHIQTCVTGAFESDDASDRQAKIDELVRIFDRNCSC